MRIQIDENLLSLLSEMDAYYFIEMLVIPKLIEYDELLEKTIYSDPDSLNLNEILDSQNELESILRGLLSYKKLLSQVKVSSGDLRFDERSTMEDLIELNGNNNKIVKDMIDKFHTFLSRGYGREQKILNLVRHRKN